MTTATSTLSSSDESSSFSLLHTGVQNAIFRLGWKKLRYIQAESIKTIIRGNEHLLVSAQTAGGKTEAAFFPIISKLAANPRPSVQALYIGPLVALINDQFQRLEQLCAHVDVPVFRWHGGASGTEKRRLRESPGGILLITPESLESNFINYGNHIRRIYAELDYVVIDELHSFLSNVRGVHLQSLLARLSAATGRQPRMIGLSATLGDPERTRTFLARDKPETVKIIQDTSMTRDVQFGIKSYLRGIWLGDEKKLYRASPDILASIAESMDEKQVRLSSPLKEGINSNPPPAMTDEFDDISHDIIRTCFDETNLIFGDSKQTIEILADHLHESVKATGWPRDPFHVHHGSLSRDLRDEVEAILKSGKNATVLCSSTLEMGIDIGSVRRVGQIDTPWSVSSMIQRLGRSGRREGESAVMRVYTRDVSPDSRSSVTDLLFPHLLRAIALARLMFAKWLEPHDSNKLNLSTLIHQILSCLKQTGGMKAVDLYSTLVTAGPFNNVTLKVFSDVLRSIAAKDLIEQMQQGELILSPAGERITSDRDFYAAFASSEELVVRHGTCEIGKLGVMSIPDVGENLVLAGRRWQVTEIEMTLKIVYVIPSRGMKKPNFPGKDGELHGRIAEETRAVLSGTEEPVYLDPVAKRLLHAARKFASLAGVTDPGFIIRPDSIQWFSWTGSRASSTLLLHALADGLKCERDELSITYKNINITQWRTHLESIIRNSRTALELAQRMRWKTFEKFDEMLSEELLDEANARSRLDLEGASQAALKTLSTISAGNSL